jgi:hypothetical protein
MNRRRFLRGTGLAAAGLALTGRAGLLAQAETPEQWRAFEITTQVEILKPQGATRAWLPTPLAVAPYQKTMGDTYHPGSGTAVMIETNASEPDMLGCSWDEGVYPALTLISRVATKAHAANLATPTVPPPLNLSSFAPFLKPTRPVPTDGIVQTKANAITKGGGTDFERAHAIYDIVLEHTVRDPTTADLNALFVSLCRAAGIPARSVYGLRVASDEATRAQHCRAEVYLTGYGWVPVDLADGRFGSWNMNWIAYNFSQDVSLRGSTRQPLAYFMYPQGETDDGPLDSLKPDGFRYSITAREV